MQLSIVSLILVACIQLGIAFDLATYKNQYQVQVAIPYKDAVTVVATDIIEYLAVSPIPNNTVSGQRIVSHINSKADIFKSHLAKGVQASDALRVQLDAEVTRLVSSGSQVEQQIVANERQLQDVNGRIQQTNAQLADAQHQVNQAAQSVQHAEQQVKEQEERVEKAKLCRGKRFSLKKAIRKVTKPIEKAVKDVVVKPVCGVVNYQGIENAKNARSEAQRRLSEQQNRLAQLQGQLAQLTSQQAALNQARANFQATKANLNGQLAQTNQARDNVNKINVGLKALIAHIGTLHGKSQVLKDVVSNLIDMETVINPISAIADQIVGYTADVSEINHLNAMKQKITASLPVIKLRLPQYALISPV